MIRKGPLPPDRRTAAPDLEAQPLNTDALRALDAWWRAANYLSVGQIYLPANPPPPSRCDGRRGTPRSRRTCQRVIG